MENKKWTLKILKIFAILVMATFIVFTAGCTPKGPVVDVLYTANLEGSFLDLPCNQMGPAGSLYTIPVVMERVRAVSGDISRKGSVPIVVDGGNTFFGVDGFSAYTGGSAVLGLMDKAGYQVAAPGRWELHNLDRLKPGSGKGIFVCSNVKPRDAAVNFSTGRTVTRGPVSVTFFSFYEPYRSPLMRDARERFDNLEFHHDVDELNALITGSGEGMKVVLCRVNDLEVFTRKLRGADLVIPGRFHPGLSPDGVTVMNGVNVAPYVNSRNHGVARFTLSRGAGRIQVGVKFYKPEKSSGIPAHLTDDYKAFNRKYSGSYSRFHSAILGVGDPGLTHGMKQIQETPTAMLVCDVTRAFARTDLAIINLMSVRKELAGIIRGEYVEWLMPFGNRLVTMEMTGGQIEALLQVNRKRRSSFMVVSGARLKYAGKKVAVLVNGKPVDKNKVYTVATNDYLARGEKLDYRIFRLGRNVRHTGLPLNGIFLSHLLVSGYLDAPPRRINSPSEGEILKMKDPAAASYENGYFELLPSLKGGEKYTPMARRYAAVDLPSSLKGINRGDHLLMQGLDLFRFGELSDAGDKWAEASRNMKETTNMKRLVSLVEKIPNPAAVPPLWPCFKGDYRHTGRSPNRGPASMPVIVWKFKTFHSNKSSPAVAGEGTIYFGGGDGFFYAVAPDGSPRWKYQAGEYILSSPAVARDGTIYFGSAPRGGIPRRQSFQDKSRKDNSSTGYFYAINPDGTLKWRFITGGWVASSPAVTRDNKVVVGCNDHHVYCLNPDGTLHWKYKTGQKILSSPAVAADGAVYFGSEDSYFYALDSNGKMKWKFKGGNKFFSSPAIDDEGLVYIGNDDGYLYVFKPGGDLAWKKKFPAPVTSTPSFTRDGDIIVGCEDGGVYRLAAGGKVKWIFKGGDEFFSSPIIDPDGRIYVGCEDNFLYCISSAGKLVWKFETGDYVESTVSIAPGGILYLSGEDKLLYALRGKVTSSEKK